MMRLGKKQVLTIVKKVEFGVYLGSDVDRVLLPKRQVPEGVEIGDPVEVLLYKDSDDRLIATTHEPKIELGELAVLEVADTGKFDVITAFHVLEHLENPLTYLAEMKKHLVPSGMLLLEVPNADDALLKLYQSSAFADFTYWHCHVYLYTNATLAELAKQAGFKVVFIEQVQRYPLANHLHWLAKGKPGGHHVWTYLQDDALDKAYGDKLAGLGMADTIIAGFAALS